MLIGRIAWLQVHLAAMDQRILQSGEMTEHTGKQYLAWANAVARMIACLGLQPPPPRQPTVEETLAAIHAMHRHPEPDDAA